MANPNMLTRIGLPLVVAGMSLGINACNFNEDPNTVLGDGADVETEATVVLTPEQQQEIGALCVNGFDMGTSLN